MRMGQFLIERKEAVLVFGLGLAAAAGAGQAAGAAASMPTSVWDGVYTEAQAADGKKIYLDNCAPCHGNELHGGENVPPLSGGLFKLHWTDKSLADLFDFLRTQMPKGQPGTLSEDEYIDVLSLILQANKYPAGDTKLTPEADALAQIKIDKKQ